MEVDEVTTTPAVTTARSYVSLPTENLIQSAVDAALREDEDGAACTLCNFVATCHSRLKIHIRQHYTNFICLCGESSYSRDALLFHVRKGLRCKSKKGCQRGVVYELDGPSLDRFRAATNISLEAFPPVRITLRHRALTSTKSAEIAKVDSTKPRDAPKADRNSSTRPKDQPKDRKSYSDVLVKLHPLDLPVRQTTPKTAGNGPIPLRRRPNRTDPMRLEMLRSIKRMDITPGNRSRHPGRTSGRKSIVGVMTIRLLLVGLEEPRLFLRVFNGRATLCDGPRTGLITPLNQSEIVPDLE